MQDKRETLTIIFYYLFTKHSVNSVVIRAVFGRQSDSTFVDRVRVRVAFTREMETRKKANRCTIATRTRDKLREFVWSGNYVLLWRIPFGYRSRLYRSASTDLLKYHDSSFPCVDPSRGCW